MIFQFIQYINPTWYFNLPSNGSYTCFPDYDLLSISDRSVLQIDNGYSNWQVSKVDAAYQAWHKGFIIREKEKTLNFAHIKPTLEDNYRFVRKYFHPFWSWYVLALRLLTFNNPISELVAWFSNRNIQRIQLNDNIYQHDKNYIEYTSDLISKQPKVSIIIPTLNRYRYLSDVLYDLEKQDYPNFEVIIVDQSDPFQADFYKSFHLKLCVIYQPEKALWLARNTAIKKSNAEYLLLFDDDSRVENNWISEHLKTLDYFKADISSGVSMSLVGAKVPKNYCYFKLSDQVDTGNVMINRKVFNKIGLFDRQFEKQRMGDGEFGLRAYLGGFINISNPYAKRLHLKVNEGGLRQMGSWDAFRPKSWLSPRPVPSVLYFFRKYFGRQAAVYALIIGIPPSLTPYRYKNRPKLLMLGGVAMICIVPLILWQLFRSWNKASKMLKEDSKIEFVQ